MRLKILTVKVVGVLVVLIAVFIFANEIARLQVIRSKMKIGLLIFAEDNQS